MKDGHKWTLKDSLQSLEKDHSEIGVFQMVSDNTLTSEETLRGYSGHSCSPLKKSPGLIETLTRCWG